MTRTKVPGLAVLLAAALAAGCGGDEAKPPASGGGAPDPAAPGIAPPAAEGSPEEEALLAKYAGKLEFPTVRYAWDPKAGDASVPAAMGGPGFTGEGWTTNMEFPAIGWPGAPKGGSLRHYMTDWPATLRLHGENWNESFNYNVNDLCVESLITVHPTTLEHIPVLATHWRISEDRQTYSFRINPEARWSDGSPVTAEDVVASWRLRMDPKCLFPSSLVVYGKFEEPVAKSKYIVEVRCREDNWRNFLYFGGMGILPAKEISIPGDQFLAKFQNSYPALSGPYHVAAADIKPGVSIAISRRAGWWGEGNPAWSGLNNIDRFVYEVVKDPALAYEKAKKGDLDLFVVSKAQWWVEEIPKLDAVKRGLLQMRKIYNDAPIGTNGLAINTRKAPLDDLRIRRALQLLMNRDLYIEKLYFNEYEPLTSYWQGGTWANPENRAFPYDPVGAVELLEEAGWTEKNRELVRVREGRPLRFEIVYRSPLSERFLTIYQEDCRKAGIQIDLKLLTPAALWKAVQTKEYELADMNWGALVFPNPETSWKGELADQVNNNNITSFRNARVDALLVEYDRAYDVKRRIEVMREIDGIIYADHPYVLQWYSPSIRFVFWNKFGMPPWGTTRVYDSSDPFWAVFWVDPEKEKALEAARKDPSKTMPVEEEKNLFWRAWNAARRRGGPVEAR